jgi:hypothetical protein
MFSIPYALPNVRQRMISGCDPTRVCMRRLQYMMLTSANMKALEEQQQFKLRFGHRKYIEKMIEQYE